MSVKRAKLDATTLTMLSSASESTAVEPVSRQAASLAPSSTTLTTTESTPARTRPSGAGTSSSDDAEEATFGTFMSRWYGPAVSGRERARLAGVVGRSHRRLAAPARLTRGCHSPPREAIPHGLPPAAGPPGGPCVRTTRSLDVRDPVLLRLDLARADARVALDDRGRPGAAPHHAARAPRLRRHRLRRSSHHDLRAVDAIRGFVAELPDGERDYLDVCRAYTDVLYGRALAKSGKQRFLDKTPAYGLVLPFLARLYPRAKYVVLTRHPAAIFCSFAESFFEGDFEAANVFNPILDRYGARALPARAAFGTPLSRALRGPGRRSRALDARDLRVPGGVPFEASAIDYGKHEHSNKGLGQPRPRSTSTPGRPRPRSRSGRSSSRATRRT